MAILAQYDDTQLATYMRDEVLKKVASLLGWTNVDPAVSPFKYAGAITQTMLWYGTVTTPVEATNITRLLLLARAAAWFSVMEETAGDVTIEDAGPVKINRKEVFDNAHINYKAAWEMYQDWLKGVGNSDPTDPDVTGRARTSTHKIQSVW